MKNVLIKKVETSVWTPTLGEQPFALTGWVLLRERERQSTLLYCGKYQELTSYSAPLLICLSSTQSCPIIACYWLGIFVLTGLTGSWLNLLLLSYISDKGCASYHPYYHKSYFYSHYRCSCCVCLCVGSVSLPLPPNAACEELFGLRNLKSMVWTYSAMQSITKELLWELVLDLKKMAWLSGLI